MYIINFTFILYFLLFLILYIFLGFGLTVLLCPKELRKYTVFLSPIIGYCLLTLTGWFFYSFNFKGTDDYYYWVLLIALFFLIAAIYKIWRQKLITNLFSRELVIPIIIIMIIFVVVSLPALRQEQMTSMSLGNNDIAFFSMASKILKIMPKNDFYLVDYFNANLVNSEFGAYINTAFFCSVAKLDPYKVQMISIYIFLIVSVLLTYILGREIYNYTGFASNFIILLYGLNSIIIYVIYQGFERQLIAVPLMLLIILSNIKIARANKFTDAILYIPLLIFALWGIALTYSHMMVIIYVLLVAYLLVSYYNNKKIAKIINWSAINCIAILVIFCLRPSILTMIISNTFIVSRAVNGWFLPLITPQELFSITPFLIPDTILQKFIGLTIILSVFLIALIVLGFIKLFKQNKEIFLFSFSSLVLIFIGALILSFTNMLKTNEGFGGYNQFKLITFFLPIILLSSYAIFGDLTLNIRNILLHPIKSNYEYESIKKKSHYFFIIAVLIIANCLSAGISLYRVFKYVTIIPPDTINLKTIHDNKEIKSINIPADSVGYWNIMWEAYFLFPKKIHFEQSTYYPAASYNGEWQLIRNTDKVLSTYIKNDSDFLQINSTYSLNKKNTIAFTARFGKGWSNSELYHKCTISNDASIVLNSKRENIKTNLTLKYWPINNKNNLSIYLNSSKIFDCESNSNCTINEILLEQGENIVEFKAKLPAELPGNGDQRNLCYCFKSIVFKEIAN